MPDDSFEKRYARLTAPTYCLALLLLILPFLDYGASVWPIQLGAVNWRYGAAGLLGGFLLTPFLGVILLGFLGVMLERRRTLGFTGAVCLLLGALLILVNVSFVLDAVQLRGSVPKDQIRVFDAGVFKAMVKLLTGAIFSWMLAFACFRAMGATAKQPREMRSTDALVVGGAKKPAASGR
ncbi:MAG TPA: hypothetical protein VFU23_09660 [Gemmatimonadales bacterium]|nr:hypothetical protein [Gemmatimonadales bacterium]